MCYDRKEEPQKALVVPRQEGPFVSQPQLTPLRDTIHMSTYIQTDADGGRRDGQLELAHAVLTKDHVDRGQFLGDGGGPRAGQDEPRGFCLWLLSIGLGSPRFQSRCRLQYQRLSAG
jgi:hypothetical protein